MDPQEIQRSISAEMQALERCEKMIAPLRERAVLAEAVCEAVLKTMNSETPEPVKAAIGEWLLKYGGNVS